MPINTESLSAGLASITAVAALWNPRSPPGSSLKTILDAQFFLGQEDCESLIGALSYFNSQKFNFGTTPALYLINTTIARFEECASTYPNNQSPTKYEFLGDIQWVVPLGSPGTAEDEWPVDPSHRAFVHLTGYASNIQPDSSTFDLDISPYISTLATPKDVNSTVNTKPAAHFSVSVPDTPRFKAAKPLPSDKRFVSLTGILTGVIFSKDGTDIQRFIVTMEQITFGPKLDGQKEGLGASPMKTPALSRTGKGPINFSRKAMSATPLTPTPSTPTPSEASGRPSRKRARTDTTDNSSDPFSKENASSS